MKLVIGGAVRAVGSGAGAAQVQSMTSNDDDEDAAADIVLCTSASVVSTARNDVFGQHSSEGRHIEDT